MYHRKQQVGDRIHPYLGFDPSRAVREKVAQFKVLFQPFVKDFNVPPVLVELDNGGAHVTEHVGYEFECFPAFRIL